MSPRAFMLIPLVSFFFVFLSVSVVRVCLFHQYPRCLSASFQNIFFQIQECLQNYERTHAHITHTHSAEAQIWGSGLLVVELNVTAPFFDWSVFKIVSSQDII